MNTFSQQDLAKRLSGAMSIDWSSKTVLLKDKYVTGVIKVRMGHDDRIKGLNIQRQSLPVAFAQPLVALE